MFSLVNNWSLVRKTTVAYVALGALLVALVSCGLWTNRSMSSVSALQITRGITGAEDLGKIASQLREERVVVYTYYSTVDENEIAKLDQRTRDARTAVDEALGEYEKLAGELAPEIVTLRANVATLNKANDRIFALHAAGGDGAMLALIKGDGRSASHAAIDQAERVMKLHHQRAVETGLESRAGADLSLYLTLFLSLSALGGLAVIWLMVGRTVSKPMAEIAKATTTLAHGGNVEVPHRGRGDEIGQMAEAVELFHQAAVDRAATDARLADEQKIVTQSLGASLDALSQGDLTQDVTADFPPAYAALKANFNAALSALRTLIGAVGESAGLIRTGAGEIAQASEDLARRTESNAASLEETSAALTQIDGRIKATAAAADRTVRRADQTITTVTSGRAVADEAVQAMGRVSESAKGIDDVIEGLDKIAFQTRVLAMNAAVEAGRAGEAGRGFAVVADLVSALAMRAEEEAKRARDQLSVTQTEIGSAVEAVQKVDGALADISGNVGEVHSLLGSMAEDNRAQANAITEIGAAIGSMDQATQQNAAMVEQTSAAARNLTSEVETLAEQAARFHTGGDSGPARQRKIEPKTASKPATRPRAKGADAAYVSPVKPLSAEAGTAVAVENGDWNHF